MSSTVFTNVQERNDVPPSYEQVFRMDDIPSAPLLPELGSAFGTAMSLRFEWDSGNRESYSFLIRDADGFLQAKGNVTNFITTLQGISGMQLFKIANYGSNVGRCQKYQVHHKNVDIGSITFGEGEAPENCLKIHTNGPQIVVKSLKLGDFAIFRGDSSLIPICKIHMPNEAALREFNGTLMFLPETGITTEEQLLCTAAAIIFKVSMKRAIPISSSAPFRTIHTTVYTAGTADSNNAFNNASTAFSNASTAFNNATTFNNATASNNTTSPNNADEDDGGYDMNCVSCFLGTIVGIIIIIFLVVAFKNSLEKGECEKRKRLGYSGYSYKEC